jgi:MFS family permease
MSARKNLQSSSILVALAVCMALQMTGFVMILPLFARRFESFGSRVEALGVSAMAFALTSTFAAPFIGMLADRFGRRPIILVSLTAYVVAFSGFLFATAAWLMILLRGLAGAFTAGLIPAITSMVGDLAPQNRRAGWIGIVNGEPLPVGLPGLCWVGCCTIDSVMPCHFPLRLGWVLARCS